MPENLLKSNHWDTKTILAYAVFSLIYFLWFFLVIGPNAMTYVFYILITSLFFAHPSSRKFFYVFLPFFIYLILYDSLRVLHNFNFFSIHNKDLYDLEVAWFGVEFNGTRATWNEYFQFHQHKFLDILSGIFYITWVPFPIFFGILLFFKKRRRLAFNFWSAFFICNLIGFIIYITLPAAPPWYYLEYGAQINLETTGQTAGLGRFDKLIGFPLYGNMYSNSANVFGALPSMHAVFPMLLTIYSLRYKNHFLTALFAISMVSIWFAAVYTSHHYIIDILLGLLCGILGFFITEAFFKSKIAQSWLARYFERI